MFVRNRLCGRGYSLTGNRRSGKQNCRQNNACIPSSGQVVGEAAQRIGQRNANHVASVEIAHRLLALAVVNHGIHLGKSCGPQHGDGDTIESPQKDECQSFDWRPAPMGHHNAQNRRSDADQRTCDHELPSSKPVGHMTGDRLKDRFEKQEGHHDQPND